MTSTTNRGEQDLAACMLIVYPHTLTVSTSLRPWHGVPEPTHHFIRLPQKAQLPVIIAVVPSVVPLMLSLHHTSR